MFLKVEVYIPEDKVAELANALNEAGYIGDDMYDYVFSASKVKGYFRPLKSAKPYLGKEGEISCVDEIKMEFRIDANCKDEVLKLIREIHPYQVPVINFVSLV